MTKNLKTTALLWSAALLTAGFAACDDSKPAPSNPSSAATPTATAKTASTQPAKPGPAHAANPHSTKPAKSTGLAWTKPADWKQVPNPNQMRIASYEIPKVDGDPEDAQMSVTQFGGSTQANIDRWKGQFDMTGDANVTEKDVGGLKVTIVEIRGTFKGGMSMQGPGTPLENWMMLTAMAHSEPNRAHFFKLTGPAKTVDASRASFDKLVASMKKE